MKKYEYENATVYIEVPNDISNIRKATEVFLKRVVLEEKKNGDSNSSRAVDKK